MNAAAEDIAQGDNESRELEARDDMLVLARLDNERLFARLRRIEAALLQGGQTAQIRCNAAIIALTD